MAGVAGDAMPRHRWICCLLFVSAFLSGQSRAQPQRSDSPQPKSSVRQVIFENGGPLSAQERKHLTEQIRRDGTRVRLDQRYGDPSGVADLAEDRVRTACQDDGYFKVQVRAVAKPVADTPTNPQFDIVIKILRYGQRYSLREIHFRNTGEFSEADLLKALPIHPGEIFSQAKFMQGLENLQQLYQSAGYVNFVDIPMTEFDEANATVDLTIDFFEGKLFRWGELYIIGLDLQRTQELTDGWQVMRGKVYSPKSLRKFFSLFFRSAPVDADPAMYTQKRLNESMGTVDIWIFFVTPPWVPDM